MKEIVAKIMEGGEVILLYSDDILDGSGENKLMPGSKLEMTRASNVTWHPDKQRWFILLPKLPPRFEDCFGVTEILGKKEGYTSREEAIADEVAILNQMLMEGKVNAETLGF